MKTQIHLTFETDLELKNIKNAHLCEDSEFMRELLKKAANKPIYITSIPIYITSITPGSKYNRWFCDINLKITDEV